MARIGEIRLRNVCSFISAYHQAAALLCFPLLNPGYIKDTKPPA